jgi:hypothetical protein
MFCLERERESAASIPPPNPPPLRRVLPPPPPPSATQPKTHQQIDSCPVSESEEQKKKTCFVQPNPRRQRKRPPFNSPRTGGCCFPRARVPLPAQHPSFCRACYIYIYISQTSLPLSPHPIPTSHPASFSREKKSLCFRRAHARRGVIFLALCPARRPRASARGTRPCAPGGASAPASPSRPAPQPPPIRDGACATTTTTTTHTHTNHKGTHSDREREIPHKIFPTAPQRERETFLTHTNHKGTHEERASDIPRENPPLFWSCGRGSPWTRERARVIVCPFPSPPPLRPLPLPPPPLFATRGRPPLFSLAQQPLLFSPFFESAQRKVRAARANVSSSLVF